MCEVSPEMKEQKNFLFIISGQGGQMAIFRAIFDKNGYFQK
jgi:hypothetical protein